MLDLDRMARGTESEVRGEFVHVWRVMQEQYADIALFTRALTERRSNLIQEDLPWQGLVNALYVEYHRILLRLFERGGEAQFRALVGKADRPSAFDIRHPEAERWARVYAGELVNGLTRETRKAMAEAIAEFIRLQIPPAEGARMLRQMLGLTPQYSRAVVNFQQALRLKGYSADYIQAKADEYSRRLLNHRARTVARTETLRALQEGQRQSFTQAVEQGVLQPNRTRRQWVTAADERTCAICAPMDGALTTLTEPWMTDIGPVQTPTDTHPQCRCTVVLVFPDASGQFPTRDPRPHQTGQPATRRTLKPKVRREP